MEKSKISGCRPDDGNI